jgi:hypothetical protein
MQAGNLDRAIKVGEAILRAEPANVLVRKAMPTLCLRRDQLAVLQGEGADDDSTEDDADGDDDDDEDEEEEDGADDEDDEEEDDDDDDDDDEEQDKPGVEAPARAAQLSREQVDRALSSSKDEPVIHALKRLVLDR